MDIKGDTRIITRYVVLLVFSIILVININSIKVSANTNEALNNIDLNSSRYSLSDNVFENLFVALTGKIDGYEVKLDNKVIGYTSMEDNIASIKDLGLKKVIDEMASRFVVVVDETKIVQYLGETFKLPVEVDKFNWYHILRKIESYADIKVERRVNEDVAFITDNGNYILDCKLPKGIDPYKFHEYLIHLTGVFETGYFLDMADQVIVGTQEGVKILEK